MKIAFTTVLFPSVTEFWDDFVNSIENQTYNNFELLIFNDGCIADKIKTKNVKTKWIDVKGNIVKIRELLIEYVVENNYEYVIFGDSDDYFSLNRVEVSVKWLKKYDLVANELIPFYSNIMCEPIFSITLGNAAEINYPFIKDKNLFGLSNVACKVSYLKSLKLESELIAVDWYIFARVFLKGAKAVFTNECNTFYRQWDNNTIGIDQNNRYKIITGLKAKYYHYKALSGFDSSYENELTWLTPLVNNLNSSETELYINEILNKNKSIFWWENIKDLMYE